MASKPTLNRMRKAANQFISCRDIEDVATLIMVPKRQLVLHSFEPDYYTFQVPKRGGKMRTIEAPVAKLMAVLRKLNFYLQCVYYFIKPAPSYGYILTPKRAHAPRNILTHAECHLHCHYMLNVDFEDFFHQVSQEDTRKLLEQHPFRLAKSAANTLAKLCTYQGRLPMGSPTSPVFSNLATVNLDQEVWQWAKSQRMKYTRFVDDITLSASQPIKLETLWHLTALCKKHNFQLNPSKTKFYEEEDTKIVTGLQVGSTVSIPKAFFQVLDHDLERLQKTVEVSTMLEGNRTADFIKRYKQQVHGKINFIGMIRGYRDEMYQKYIEQYEQAIDPEVEVLSLHWMDFPY